MKRCFSMALILALLGTMSAAPALSEEAEVVSENVEAFVEPAELAGDTGLTVEGALDFAPEQTSEEANWESPANDIFTAADAAFTDETSAEALPVPEGEQAAEPGVLAPDAEEEEVVDEPKAATGIQLSASAVTIGVKESYTGLATTALPKGSAMPAVSWRSSNKKYVKVNKSTGVITGVRKGSATVYAKMEGGEEVACKVTVKAAPKKISLTPKKLTLSAGMTAKLGYTLTKGTASGALKCKSSKKTVATVDANGVVTAVGTGSATITVKTFNGKKATCKVKVIAAPASVAFPCSDVSVAVNQKTSLCAVGQNANGEETPAAITYALDASSPDIGCVALDSETGSITGLAKGEALVVATTQNGISALCRVSVAPAPKAVKLNASTAAIGVGEKFSGLAAETVAPDGEDECATAVTWSSSNKKIAKVNASTGVITGVAKGSCTITVKTANGKKATCKVTVRKAPSKISSMEPKSGKLTVGQVGQYKVTLPKDCGGSVTFASSDSGIAVVDNSGLVTAVAPGEVTITATTFNGKTATVSLLVTPAEETTTDTVGGDSNVNQLKEGMTNAELLEYVIYVAQTKLGKPYVYGSFGPDSFDCSGFTTYCFRQINIELKHSAYTQGYDASQKQLTMAELKRGDLVFFDTVADSDLSDHSGLYIGNGKFIHASSSGKKVIISDLSKPGSYYNRVFSWGRRVLD